MTDAIARALSRAAHYRVLAAAFAYPMAGHAGRVGRAAADAANAAAPVLRPALDELVQAAEAAESEGLAELYVSLFDGPVTCPPCEGAYGVPQMSGKAMQLADIAGFYAAFGMSTTGGQPDADDHIGAELEFMASLALKEAWALASDDADNAETVRRAQQAFLDDHLARWGEAFAARVVEVAPPGFFTAAARLLVAWLREECAHLAVVPRPLGGPAPSDDAPLACPMAEPPSAS